MKTLVRLAGSLSEQTPSDGPKADVDASALVEELVASLTPEETSELELMLSEMEDGAEPDTDFESLVDGMSIGEATGSEGSLVLYGDASDEGEREFDRGLLDEDPIFVAAHAAQLKFRSKVCVL